LLSSNLRKLSIGDLHCRICHWVHIRWHIPSLSGHQISLLLLLLHLHLVQKSLLLHPLLHLLCLRLALSIHWILLHGILGWSRRTARGRCEVLTEALGELRVLRIGVVVLWRIDSTSMFRLRWRWLGELLCGRGEGVWRGCRDSLWYATRT